jgi:hypothetical protein
MLVPLDAMNRIASPWLIGGTMVLTMLGCSGKSHSATPPPIIYGLTTPQGQSGSSFMISGAGFTGAMAVTIGGVEVSHFDVLDDNEITAWVATDAQTGPIAITTPGGTTQTSSIFYVLPVVTGLTSTTDPTAGATMNPGDKVTVTGSGFIGTTAVAFYGPGSSPVRTSAAPYSAVSANQITTTVPSGIPAGAGYVLEVVVPGPSGGTLSSGANVPPGPLFTIN